VDSSNDDSPLRDGESISLSISVVSYHSPTAQITELLSSLSKALQQLASLVEQLEIRLFLIDNSEQNSLSFDQSSDLPPGFSGLDVQIAVLQGHGNIGYGSGHNLAIRTTRCEYHLILNPDVLLDAHCRSQGLQYLQRNANVAMVSPYAETASGSKQYLCKRYPSLLTLLIRGALPKALRQLFKARLAHYEMRDLPEQNPSVGIPLLSGCFMLCRTVSLAAVNGFDESYFMYFEDFDLSLRMAQIGELAYLPSMKIKHFGGNTSNKGLNHIIMFNKSALRFFSRHQWRFV